MNQEANLFQVMVTNVAVEDSEKERMVGTWTCSEITVCITINSPLAKKHPPQQGVPPIEQSDF
jgi:hypothetical protein